MDFMGSCYHLSFPLSPHPNSHLQSPEPGPRNHNKALGLLISFLTTLVLFDAHAR